MGDPVASQIATARSTAARSASSGRLSAQSARLPRPDASNCWPAKRTRAPSSQWISVSMPSRPAAAMAAIISVACVSNAPNVMNTLRLVCPASASSGSSARVSGEPLFSTGCST
jgi:hypothetical protein